MITKDTNIHAKGIIVKSENEVIISFVDESSVNITEELLHENLSEHCMIEKEQMLNPQIKVVGIDNTFNMNLTEIEQDINERNFENYDTKCQAVHMYTNKNTNLNSVILEVPATIHRISQIMEYRKSIFVGYQKYRVFDIINTNPCANCAGFGHNSNKCQNKVICLICAGEHKTVQCDSRNNLKCANCAFSNLKHNTKYDCNHEATDSDNCNIFKNKIRKYIASVDYLIKPKINKYINKVGKEEHNNTPKITDGNTQQQHLVKSFSNLPTNSTVTVHASTSSTSAPTPQLVNSKANTPQQVTSKANKSTVKNLACNFDFLDTIEKDTINREKNCC